MVFYNIIKNIYDSYFLVENKWFSIGFRSKNLYKLLQTVI